MNESSPTASRITFSDDYSVSEITQKMYEDYRGISNDSSYLDTNTIYEISDNGNFDNLGHRFAGNTSVDLFMRVFGGDSITYRTAVFINHELVQINGADYIEFTVGKGNVAEFSFSLELNPNERYSTFYTITTPIGQNYLKLNAFPHKTQSQLLVNENIPAVPNETAVVDPAPPAETSETVGTAETPSTITPAPVSDTSTNSDLTGIVSSLNDGIASLRYLGNDRLVITTTRTSSGSSEGFGFGSSSDSEHKILIANTATLNIERQTTYYKYETFGVPAIFSDRILVAACGAGKTDILVFDHNLNHIETVNLASALGGWGGFASEISFNSDGSKIILCNEYGNIISVDLQSKRAETIFDVSRTDILTINYVSFCNNDRQIAFYGTTPDSRGDGVPIYGLITLADNSVKFYDANIADTRIQLTTNFAFWDERAVDFGSTSTGKAFMIDYATSSLSTFSFNQKNESQNAYISSDGKRIVTLLINVSNGTTTVRVYNVDSKAIIDEFVVSGNVNSVAFSANNRKFVLTCFEVTGSTRLLEYNV
jgi:hypothetical protein